MKEPNSNQTFGLVQLTGLKSLVHQLDEGNYPTLIISSCPPPSPPRPPPSDTLDYTRHPIHSVSQSAAASQLGSLAQSAVTLYLLFEEKVAAAVREEGGKN